MKKQSALKVVSATVFSSETFRLPFFGEAAFRIEGNIADLATGIGMVADLADALALDITHAPAEGEQAAHAVRVLVGLMSGAAGEIERQVGGEGA
jgi:hypothetical protein